ncbi:hypothetical protein [Chryseolinea lacunae]|uniref:Uncharacterized protein n=1 Tax=Chryseolinea lacunae TaxID=2801331 RepID=A0ABS1KXC1_9BACT|nr:hypothetical protein [Chryseolinea lacunae]MBL0744105.1 hypothetical protein [Chryseolinea lacunae]
MKHEEETLTTQQSLAIITEMILNTKGNLKSNSIYFLLWGVVIALANLGMFALIMVDYPYPYIAWTAAFPAWLASFYIGYRQSKRERVMTHLDRVSIWMWVTFGVITFTLMAFGKLINYQLNPVILLVSAIPTLLSGIIIRFRPLIVGGILFWVAGIACFAVGGPWQFLIGAAAVTAGFIVPGVLLRSKKED